MAAGSGVCALTKVRLILTRRHVSIVTSCEFECERCRRARLFLHSLSGIRISTS